MTLTPLDIQRYVRQLPLIGHEGQVHLLNSKVLCVGAGGLGAPVLQYLAAAGVGMLGIVDGDQVELSNLQRQVIFTPDDIGKNKALRAKRYLEQFNPSVQTITYETFLTQENAEKIMSDFEVVIDCTDNYHARYLLNDVCVKVKKPLISASIYQFQGQCSVFNYQGGPCYRCLYESPPSAELIPNCALGGVLGVLPGILGCIQATETIKILLDKGDVLAGRLFTIDTLSMKTNDFKIPKNPHCPCCHEGQSALELFSKNEDPIEIQEINPEQLVQWLENKSDIILMLDVREPYEREICHIGGQSIPLRELNAHLTKLPKNKHIICYCKSGQRSRQAARLLKNNGFSQVSSLQGGMIAWIDSIDNSLTRY